jgi:hypothetical protein
MNFEEQLKVSRNVERAIERMSKAEREAHEYIKDLMGIVEEQQIKKLRDIDDGTAREYEVNLHEANTKIVAGYPSEFKFAQMLAKSISNSGYRLTIYCPILSWANLKIQERYRIIIKILTRKLFRRAIGKIYLKKNRNLYQGGNMKIVIFKVESIQEGVSKKSGNKYRIANCEVEVSRQNGNKSLMDARCFCPEWFKPTGGKTYALEGDIKWEDSNGRPIGNIILPRDKGAEIELPNNKAK